MFITPEAFLGYIVVSAKEMQLGKDKIKELIRKFDENIKILTEVTAENIYFEFLEGK